MGPEEVEWLSVSRFYDRGEFVRVDGHVLGVLFGVASVSWSSVRVQC